MNDAPWLIVGLGNPGPDYAGTRHNAGAMVVAELGARAGGTFGSHKRAQADVLEARLAGHRVVLALPRSFMNTSGGPTKALAGFYKVPLEQLIVIHDELDLPLAAVRVKFGGGDNGHNGLKSIRSALGSGEYARIRMGIGRPPGRQDPADFVLRRFSGTETTEIKTGIELGADAVETLVSKGLEAAQNEVNGSSRG
jgi:peptidyl-tRNA hydrolase, PTH1 family